MTYAYRGAPVQRSMCKGPSAHCALYWQITSRPRIRRSPWYSPHHRCGHHHPPASRLVLPLPQLLGAGGAEVAKFAVGAVLAAALEDESTGLAGAEEVALRAFAGHIRRAHVR